jgi:hypothetical protein
MNPEVLIKYMDVEESPPVEREVTLKAIIREIGFDYGIPDNVFRLCGENNFIKEIFIDGKLVWRNPSLDPSA